MYKKATRSSMMMSFNVIPVYAFAHEDVMDIVTGYAFGASWRTVSREIPICIAAQDCVPPSFLLNELPCRYEWGRQPNPYKRFNPYTPIQKLIADSPWSYVPGKLAHSICRRSIRKLKTYRGVMMRHTIKMMNGPIQSWNQALEKVWKRLNISHFRRNVSGSMIRKLMEEITYSSPLPLCF